MKSKSVKEYSVVGADIEEHFDSYSEAKDFCKSLTNYELEQTQFFSKEWVDGNEGEVIVFKEKGKGYESIQKKFRRN